jgi:hypothetical protein
MPFLVIAFAFLPREVAAQSCPTNPYYVPHPGTESITPYVSRNGQACQEGSYVRQGTTQYVVDFYTQATGYCEVYVTDQGQCVLHEEQFRGIGATIISELSAPGWKVVYPNPDNGPTQLDTRPSKTSTPDVPQWNFVYEGERTLRFDSTLNSTACNLTPFYTDKEVGFKAVKCLPQWKTTMQGALMHNDPTTINVRIPTNMPLRMRQGIENAVKAWNAALNQYGSVGPRYDDYISDTVCGGSACINTEIGNINVGLECAEANTNADPSTGIITSSTITFPTQSANWNQNFNNRLAAHELGHHLGLANNGLSSCQTANSLMKPVTCDATSGYPTAPTLSDVLPVVRSTYEGHTTSTCP